MKLKTAPKIILIGIITAAVGYGINTLMNAGTFKTPDAPPPVSQQSVPVETSTPVQAEAQTPVPIDITPAQPNPTANAGLAKLLQSTK